MTTVEYFYLSKAVITDMTLFVFYSACLMAFYIAYSEKKPAFYYAAYAFAGLSVLTKGPIGSCSRDSLSSCSSCGAAI